MEDSVRERIMQHIQTTLESVTVANGYANTLQSVQRFRQDGQVLSSTPVAVVLEGGDDVDDEGPLAGGYGLISRSMTVSIVLIHQQDTAIDTRSASAVMNTLIADVQKAMQADYSRGGVAVDTREVGVGELDAQEGQAELVQAIGFRIRYRHSRVDPAIAG